MTPTRPPHSHLSRSVSTHRLVTSSPMAFRRFALRSICCSEFFYPNESRRAYAFRRLSKEWKKLENDLPIHCLKAGPVDGDMFHWEATIMGPPDSPYAGGIFIVTIDFSQNYPFKAPKITFRTKVFHPNITGNGSVCLGTLERDWSPAMTVYHHLLWIVTLLNDPNTHDPSVPEIAEIYKTNKTLFETTAKIWTQNYATRGGAQAGARSRKKVYMEA